MRRLSLRHLLRSEQGIALPMALGVMLASTVSVTAMLQMSSSSARSAGYSLAGQNALQTAEAGLNQASSLVASAPTNASALPACPPSEPPVGGVSWCGTLIGNVWNITSTAVMANPTGPGAAPVRRTLEASFELESAIDMSAWQGVFTWAQEKELLQNGGDIFTPLHLKQGGTDPIEIKNNSRYMGEYLAVDGALRILDTASVGTATDWVNNVLVSNGCNSSPSCGPTQKVWRHAFSNTVPYPDRPVIDFTAMRLNAKPGPGTVGSGPGKWPNGCSTSSGTVPSFTSSTFNPFTGSAYDCQVDVNADGVLEGRLKWQPSTSAHSPGTLTVLGDIYADGGLNVVTTYAVVSGKAALYLGGKVMFEGDNSALCGQAELSHGRPFCDDAWDPNTTSNILMLYVKSSAADAVDIKNRFELQGGLYTEGKLMIQNTAKVKGPILSKTLEVKDTVDVQGFTPITNVLPGVPGSSSSQTYKLVPGSWRG